MDGYKHYIRTDANGIVVKGFTDGFEQPQQGDLLLSGQDGRHFQLQLSNERGQFIYKLVNGSMVSRTQEELELEWNSRPPAPKTEMEIVKEENVQLTAQIIDLWETLISSGVL
jgi:hypothetical protein